MIPNGVYPKSDPFLKNHGRAVIVDIAQIINQFLTPIIKDLKRDVSCLYSSNMIKTKNAVGKKAIEIILVKKHKPIKNPVSNLNLYPSSITAL